MLKVTKVWKPKRAEKGCLLNTGYSPLYICLYITIQTKTSHKYPQYALTQKLCGCKATFTQPAEVAQIHCVPSKWPRSDLFTDVWTNQVRYFFQIRSVPPAYVILDLNHIQSLIMWLLSGHSNGNLCVFFFYLTVTFQLNMQMFDSIGPQQCSHWSWIHVTNKNVSYQHKKIRIEH